MKSVPVLFKLVLAHNLKRWVRMTLGILGIAVSICLVVWIIRGYEAAALDSSRSAQQESRFDVAVTPPSQMMMPGQRGGGPGGQRPPPPSMDAAAKYVDDKWIEGLRRDDAVAEVVPLITARIRLIDPPPQQQMGPFGGATLVGTDSAQPLQALAAGNWLTEASVDAAVISGGFGERNQLKLNDSFVVGGIGGEVRLTVAGMLQAAPGGGGQRMGPGMGAPHLGDIYVRPEAAEKINGFGGRINAVVVSLKEKDDLDGFVAEWEARTATAQPPVSVRALRQKDNPMADRMMGMVKVQAQNATVLGFLAACFIIFATLSGGVRERLRELASLRAIALSRPQLVLMILIEAVLLAVIGWGAGLLLARGLLRAGNALAVHLQFFQAGAFGDYPLGATAIRVSGICALVGSLAAAIPPIWSGCSLRPMDILGGPTEARVRRFPWRMVSIGAALIVLNPVLVLMANVEPFKTLFAKTYKMGFAPPLLGSAAAILGLALVTPLVVRLVEQVFSPVLALVLRIDRRFLRQQLTGNLRRTVGTTVSLSAGLTLFVTALVWGYSMLVPFTPDESLPRMLVSILPAGVPTEAVAEVAAVDGVTPGECLAMSVEQPRLTETMLASKPFESVDASQQHLLFMGVDPARAFSGKKPVLNFAFLQGDRETAARKLATGRYCLVPDHFHTQTGLGVGDKFSVAVPNEPGREVEYEIAGVVSVPGWNWFTKFSEIRRRAGRALAVVFADFNQVQTDFKLDRISFFWMNVDKRVDYPEMEQRLAPVANRHAGVTVDVPGVGPALINKQYVKITERGDLTARLFRRADDVIWQLTRFPLLALIIASLAVFNTMFASVQARSWQFGILRGVGLSRGQLFRLVISESLMIFLAAGVLSLAAGVLLAWCGIHVCTYFFYFAGRTPPLVLPWSGLSLGFGIAFGLCFLAGLIPAWRMARKEPLAFIQAGRLSV